MNQKALEEVVSSRARLQIVDLVSVRPRTLRELSAATGISVQAVLKHIARLERIGVVEEKKVEGGSLPVRKVYAARGARIGDFSHGDLTIVKVSSLTERPVRSEEPLKELESLAADALVEKRRIRDQARRLGRAIDELANTEARIGRLVDGLGVSDQDGLILKAAYTEESMEEAERALAQHFGLREPRRDLEKAISRARKLGKK